jgi:hypothetical protein
VTATRDRQLTHLGSPVVVEQDVGGLEVAVHDGGGPLVEEQQGRCRLCGDAHDVVPAQRSVVGAALQVLLPASEGVYPSATEPVCLSSLWGQRQVRGMLVQCRTGARVGGQEDEKFWNMESGTGRKWRSLDLVFGWITVRACC